MKAISLMVYFLNMPVLTDASREVWVRSWGQMQGSLCPDDFPWAEGPALC